MWCDNCLLLFPRELWAYAVSPILALTRYASHIVRGGAMVLAALIALYSIAGGIFLFMYGQFFYFRKLLASASIAYSP